MDAWIIWLIAAAILIAIEVMTQTMWSLCLAAGALCAMILSLFGLTLPWQVGALAAGAIMAYIIFLPVFRKWYESKNKHETRTGMDALLGRKATVTHEIKPGGLGRARIDGDNWQVKAPGIATTIPAGSEVTVTSYDSIILTVAPCSPS
ncbi:MAG: NfeD family protein [Muribaculaceae bacterium]|nr:NfeD family protein [Muribaculaceae bacterium]